MRLNILILILISSFVSAKDLPIEVKSKLDKHLENAERRHGIFAQSVAILKNGKLVYLNATGKANIEFNVAATPDTIYSIYSVTKLFVTTRLLQLVEQDKLQLNDTLGKHFPNAPSNWHSVTVLEMLSHVSGIPEYSQETMSNLPAEDAISAVENNDMEFETGSQSSYNQTNFYYIQKLIEKFDNTDLVASLNKTMLKPVQLQNTSFGGEFHVISGRATRYEGTRNGIRRVMRNDPPPYYYAANGMNSTVKDIATWFQALLDESFINKDSLKSAWQPLLLTNGQKARHTHGWEISNMNGYTAVGHYGGNFVNVRHFFKQDIVNDTVTVIHLTNGRSKRFNPLEFSYTLASEVNQQMKTPIRTLEESMMSAIDENKVEQALSQYSKFKVDFPVEAKQTEGMLNTLGYFTLSIMGAEHAIKIFQLNTTEYPDSANTYDSLAEAYLKMGNKSKAKQLYQQVLSLEPDNSRVNRIIEQLK